MKIEKWIHIACFSNLVTIHEAKFISCLINFEVLIDREPQKKYCELSFYIFSVILWFQKNHVTY